MHSVGKWSIIGRKKERSSDCTAVAYFSLHSGVLSQVDWRINQASLAPDKQVRRRLATLDLYLSCLGFFFQRDFILPSFFWSIRRLVPRTSWGVQWFAVHTLQLNTLSCLWRNWWGSTAHLVGHPSSWCGWRRCVWWCRWAHCWLTWFGWSSPTAPPCWLAFRAGFRVDRLHIRKLFIVCSFLVNLAVVQVDNYYYSCLL